MCVCVCVCVLGIDHGGLTVNDVQIPGCTGIPCKLKEGQNITFSLKYTASECYFKVTTMKYV